MAYQLEQDGNPELSKMKNQDLINVIEKAGYAFPVVVNFLTKDIRVISEEQNSVAIRRTRRPQSRMIRLTGYDTQGGGTVRCFESRRPDPKNIGSNLYAPRSIIFTRQKKIEDPKLAYYLVFHAPNIKGNEVFKNPLYRSEHTLMRIQDMVGEARAKAQIRVQKNRFLAMASVVTESSDDEKNALYSAADTLGIKYDKTEPIEVLSDQVYGKINSMNTTQLDRFASLFSTNNESGEFSLVKELETTGLIKYGNNATRGWWKLMNVDGTVGDTIGETFDRSTDKYEAGAAILNEDTELAEDLSKKLAAVSAPAN